MRICRISCLMLLCFVLLLTLRGKAGACLTYDVGNPLYAGARGSRDQSTWTADTVYVGINQPVYFKAVKADESLASTIDMDTLNGVLNQSDTATYNWTFGDGQNGSGVQTDHSYTSPGIYTVTLTVNDAATYYNDAQKTDTVTVQVIRLDKIRVYFSTTTGSAYPYTSDQFKTRAVVWATVTLQNLYCDIGFDEGLTWWKTGNEGPQGDGDVPPTSGTFGDTVTDNWPDQWPSLSITWKLLDHSASASVNYNRIYSYSESSYLTGWGEDNRSYNTPGMHRLRANAKMNVGTGYEQSVTSLDKEYALRICIKDPNIYSEPDPPPGNSAQRQTYLRWLSTYEDEPYEWGGEGYGGKDSAGNYAGGSASYDGYGIDCSGLVSCGAYRAGYDWPSWRQTTSGLPSVSTAVTSPWKDNLIPGDIINKPQHHVISYRYTTGASPSRKFYVIEASGSDCEVLKRWRSETYLNAACDADPPHDPLHYYQGRVLTQY